MFPGSPNSMDSMPTSANIDRRQKYWMAANKPDEVTSDVLYQIETPRVRVDSWIYPLKLETGFSGISKPVTRTNNESGTRHSFAFSENHVSNNTCVKNCLMLLWLSGSRS
jgi:hypothetical protein